ncbi:MAG: DHA2 family efflux MFS transporter permease subunit [Plectolyngbya sp. WJT66-NPBG17]|jgi:DHA2 family multidrug resistance protein|nr:DHA2 family efflux MFS transporter permease subunit [Plectolyngbya sp. WJT66-NPBG17]
MVKTQVKQPTDSVSAATWLAVIGLNLGALMSALDVTATNASLEDMTGALSATLDQGSWIATAYLIGEIIVVPLTGWLGGIFSIRWYMTISTVLFLAFSVACANATTLSEMIAFRGLQGFFAGAFVPVAMAYVLRHLPPSKHTIGLAIFGLTVTSGPAVGPALGGWLTYNYSWQYIFYINLIPGSLMLATCLFLIEHEPMQLKELKRGDWAGILTMAVGLACLQTVLEEGNRDLWFNSSLIVQLTTIAVVSLVLFLIIELTRSRPFINLRVMQRRNLALASFISFVAGCGIFGALYVMPVYLDTVQNYTPYQVGLTLMWVGVGSVIVMPFLPIIQARVDSRVIVAVGCAIYAISNFINSHLSAQSGTPQLMLPEFIQGIGQSLITIPLSALATTGIPGKQLSDASALFNQVRYLGGSFADAIFATIIQHRSEFHYDRLRGDVSLYNEVTQQRLQEMKQYFMSQGADAATATRQAIGAIAQAVQQQATIMAINDCYHLLGLLILMSGTALLLMKKVKTSGNIAVE